MNLESKKQLIAEAIDEYRNKEQRTRKERVYHNTKLLMENYNALKQHVDSSIYKASQMLIAADENNVQVVELYDKDDILIETIHTSKLRTTIIMIHIDTALNILKSNSDSYKYDSFIDFYVNRLSYKELAEKYHATERTIRRWSNEMINELGILFFGEKSLLFML